MMDARKWVVLSVFFGKFPREVDLLKIFDIINIRDVFFTAFQGGSIIIITHNKRRIKEFFVKFKYIPAFCNVFHMLLRSI